MTSTPLDPVGLVEAAGLLHDDLVRVRHALHRTPEVGLHLPRTQALVLAELSGLPVEVHEGRECSSVVAVLRGEHPGPTVLLRGDMDALPLTELAEVPYASEVPGAMHACGHDMHTAMLLGAVRLLCNRRDQLHGDVVFMFQPGEEGYHGAAVMLREGLLERHGSRPVAAYAAHVYSGSIPRGVVTSRAGAVTSASAAMTVTVRGSGGHASRPHLMRDPVVAACDMVTSLQTAVARRIDVFDPVVLTVGRIEGGSARNIIPDSCRFEATVRAYSPQARDRIAEIAAQVCRGVADTHGLEVDVEYVQEYPAMMADPQAADVVESVVTALFGAERHQTQPRPMYGSEDFAFVLEEVPGAFAILGATPLHIPLDQAASNHAATVVFDDGVLPDGAALLAGLAAWHLLAPDGSGGRRAAG